MPPRQSDSMLVESEDGNFDLGRRYLLDARSVLDIGKVAAETPCSTPCDFLPITCVGFQIDLDARSVAFALLISLEQDRNPKRHLQSFLVTFEHTSRCLCNGD